MPFLPSPLEPAYLDAFESLLRRCAVGPGDTVAVLCETQSRAELPELARLAAARLGCQVFTLTLPTVFERNRPVSRSTGASNAIDNIAPVVAALASSTLVVDCTVEGLMHAPELAAILRGGARVVYVSNEHPEALVRLLPGDDLEALVKAHVKQLRGARSMQVRSAAGTDLRVELQSPSLWDKAVAGDKAVVGGNWGSTTRAGTMTHWPGGLVLAFPTASSVNGTLVLDVGDVNLTFKRYIERPITLTLENDCVTRIEGQGVDADLLRSYIAAWGETADDRNAYAVSHVGYGLNTAARWDSMALYDKRDFNGTELRAFSGNFLFSTGANEVAGRFTQGHFDLPMRGCTVTLDGVDVVRAGVVQALA
jgi:2,5-dihydroxypyridine 5,6-dioxygenase